MTSQLGYQTITIYIVPNISRSKGNQTIKFGQATEYNKTFRFSDVFRGYRKATLGCNGLKLQAWSLLKCFKFLGLYPMLIW